MKRKPKVAVVAVVARAAGSSRSRHGPLRLAQLRQPASSAYWGATAVTVTGLLPEIEAAVAVAAVAVAASCRSSVDSSRVRAGQQSRGLTGATGATAVRASALAQQVLVRREETAGRSSLGY